LAGMNAFSRFVVGIAHIHFPKRKILNYPS
jgi:hypothetical protein